MTLDTLRSWERWGVWACLAALVLFGALVVRRAAFSELRRTDADVFFRAAWAVRVGEDPYLNLSERDWNYTYPPLLAALLQPLADPPTAGTFASRQQRLRAEATRRGWDAQRLERELLAASALGERLAPKIAQPPPLLLPFWASVTAWYALSLGAVLLAAHLLAGAATAGLPAWRSVAVTPAHRAWWTLRFWPVAFCLPGIGNGLSRGQSDALILLAIAAVTRLAVSGRTFWAGWAVSAAAAVKVFPAVLGAYALRRLDVRMLLGCAVGGMAFFVAVPAVFVGPARAVESNARWLRGVGLPAFGLGGDDSRKFELYGLSESPSQSLLSITHNYVNLPARRGQRPADPSALTRGVHAAASAAMLALTLWAIPGGLRPWRRPLARAGPDPNAALSVGCLAAVMIAASPVCHMHYFAFHLPLMTALVARWAALHPAQSLPLKGWAVGGAYAAVHVVSRLPGPDHALQDLGLPMASGLALWAMGVGALRRAGL
ncbi:MAG: hypothetical protein C0475_00415 [Planctomyces sp.]|nr:hypothetical protein [Planctomyces sp.]